MTFDTTLPDPVRPLQRNAFASAGTDEGRSSSIASEGAAPNFDCSRPIGLVIAPLGGDTDVEPCAAGSELVLVERSVRGCARRAVDTTPTPSARGRRCPCIAAATAEGRKLRRYIFRELLRISDRHPTAISNCLAEAAPLGSSFSFRSPTHGRERTPMERLGSSALRPPRVVTASTSPMWSSDVSPLEQGVHSAECHFIRPSASPHKKLELCCDPNRIDAEKDIDYLNGRSPVPSACPPRREPRFLFDWRLPG